MIFFANTDPHWFTLQFRCGDCSVSACVHIQLDLHTFRDNLYTQSQNHVKQHFNSRAVMSCAKKKKLIRDQVIYDTTDTW